MAENHIQEGNTTMKDGTLSGTLTQQEMDIVGEIANISFGSASTILSTLLNKPVSITTPRVEVVDLFDTSEIILPHVVLNIQFIKGLEMENLFVLKREVALAMADLMMMGTGEVDPNQQLTELDLSAVQEAMNQMMGFAATSMSDLFQDTVDMTPPGIKVVNLAEEIEKISHYNQTSIVTVSFDLRIGTLVNSKLVQIVSMENVRQMVNKLMRLSEPLPSEVPAPPAVEQLTQEEKDTLGEISNISIGSASTVLSALLNQPVTISVPNVEVINVRSYEGVPFPYLVLNVDFTEGFHHENVFVLSKEVALTMVDLMMMGTGEIDADKELDELEMSGVKEVMNQMMAHAATALSEMFQKKVDITPPTVKVVSISEELKQIGASNESDELIQIAFHLEIGTFIRSTMYQFFSIPEGKEIVKRLLRVTGAEDLYEADSVSNVTEAAEGAPVSSDGFFQFENVMTEQQSHESQATKSPLLSQVEVELEFVFGSTTKMIDEVLSLRPDEVGLLEEAIDEPLRIYANGVLIAHGELVNVDGFFGIRVIEAL